MGFQKATREKLKLRMAIDGPTKSGKTLTALRIAMAMARYYNVKVGVICSEQGKCRLYVGMVFDEYPIEFEVNELDDFSPKSYVKAIQEAEKLGIGVIVIDQISHEWKGKGGVLQLVDKASNKFNEGWKNVTPMHDEMIQAILTVNAHIICTMRSKMDYIMEESTNAQGKTVTRPTKVGLAPVQREGIEYEFDIYGSMDNDNTMRITGTRCSALKNAAFFEPGEEVIKPIVEWLETGEAERPASAIVIERLSRTTLAELISAVNTLGMTDEALERELLKRYSVSRLADLTEKQAKDFSVRKRLGGKAVAARNTVVNPSAQMVGSDSEDSVPPAPSAKDGADTSDNDSSSEQTVDVSTVMAEVSSNPPKTLYADPDAPVSKGMLGSLNNAFKQFLGAGGSQSVIDGGLTKRTGGTDPKKLTNAQAEELEAKILKIVNGPHETKEDTQVNPQ